LWLRAFLSSSQLRALPSFFEELEDLLIALFKHHRRDPESAITGQIHCDPRFTLHTVCNCAKGVDVTQPMYAAESNYSYKGSCGKTPQVAEKQALYAALEDVWAVQAGVTCGDEGGAGGKDALGQWPVCGECWLF